MIISFDQAKSNLIEKIPVYATVENPFDGSLITVRVSKVVDDERVYNVFGQRTAFTVPKVIKWESWVEKK
jgi:uncharacterized membrane protein